MNPDDVSLLFRHMQRLAAAAVYSVLRGGEVYFAGCIHAVRCFAGNCGEAPRDGRAMRQPSCESAGIVSDLGHNAEGMYEVRRAESLDPASPIIRSNVADALSVSHLFEQSIQQSRKTLALDPQFAVGHLQLGEALVHVRQYEAAIAEFQRAIELSGHLAAFDANLAHAYALSGRRADALKIAKEMEARPGLNPAANASIALIYVGLGDLGQAMSWLNKAYDARFNPSIRPEFDPLRSDARFRDLRHRIGLPT
jgi:tetratricopeptide (TPR) repeat protein